MLNTETMLYPKLQHFGLLTGNLQLLLDWYQKVLGMRTIHESENPTDAPTGSPASRLKRPHSSATTKSVIVSQSSSSPA